MRCVFGEVRMCLVRYVFVKVCVWGGVCLVRCVFGEVCVW